jgi:hypothetical protein
VEGEQNGKLFSFRIGSNVASHQEFVVHTFREGREVFHGERKAVREASTHYPLWVLPLQLLHG